MDVLINTFPPASATTYTEADTLLLSLSSASTTIIVSPGKCTDDTIIIIFFLFLFALFCLVIDLTQYDMNCFDTKRYYFES